MLEKIMAYENGELSPKGTLELFSELLKSGLIGGLQGHYQRMASNLIDARAIDPTTYDITPHGLSLAEGYGEEES